MCILIDSAKSEEQTLLYMERVSGTGMPLLLVGLFLILLFILLSVYVYRKRHGKKKALALQSTVTTNEITQELSELPEWPQQTPQDTLADICFCESKEIIP